MLNILVAEDDLASLKFMEKYLSAYGTVDAAHDGIEAVDFFFEKMQSGKPYDLVCLDIMMPRVDGYKALDAIRDIEAELEIDQEKRCKIVMASALSELDQQEPYKENMHDGYVMKPIDIPTMDKILQDMGFQRDDALVKAQSKEA